MSCIVVSDNHINALLTFIHRDIYQTVVINDKRFDVHQTEDLQNMADIMLAENERAYDECYPDEAGQEPETIQFRVFRKTHLAPVEIIKLCQSYQYQLAEFDGYEDTTAYKIADYIKGRAISQLPGWEESAWMLE